MTAHTPGPWKALRHITMSNHTPDHIRIHNGAKQIASAFYGDQKTMAANARLLAAAPDLLAALKAVLESGVQDLDSQAQTAISKARAAIAKATQ